MFKYGPAFLAINEFHFSHYKECKNSDDMVKAIEEVKKALEKEREENKNREIDYGPGSDSEEEKSGDRESKSEESDSEEERRYYAEINKKILEKADGECE